MDEPLLDPVHIQLPSGPDADAQTPKGPKPRTMVFWTVLGISTGLICYWSGASDDVAFWLGYPGALFLRALKCLVVPMIFCSMVVGVADLSALGSGGSGGGTGKVGSRALALYMSTTALAATEGLIVSAIFKPLYSQTAADAVTVGASLTLQCPTGKFMAVAADGETVACSASAGDETFLADDTSGFWAEAEPLAEKDLQDTFADVGYSLVPENIVAAAATPDILSLITFGCVFGWVVAQQTPPAGQRNLIMDLVHQVNAVVTTLIGMVVRVAPYGIASLVASALAETSSLGELLRDVGLLLVCVLLGLALHVGATLPAIFRALVGELPYAYMGSCKEAYLFAWGSASSAATLPVTISCVERHVPASVARFVCSLGSVINMDGSSVYYISAVVYMAAANGVDMNAATFFTMALVASLGSVGSSPIPSAGLVMLITIWSSVFPGIEVPPQIAYVQAVDFIVDRFVTATNVCGDSMVARIVAALCPEAQDAATVKKQRAVARRLSDAQEEHVRAAVAAAMSDGIDGIDGGEDEGL